MAHRASALLGLLMIPLACGAESPAHDDDVPVRVGMVAVDNSNVPVVILEEEGGDRLLPIWIGSFEARSIASQMEEIEPPRPNTHDLARSLISQLAGKVVRVVVTDLREGTYYAVLSLRANGSLLQLDSRPSDAIAIALRTGAPIFVRAPVFDAADDGGDSEARGRRIEWRMHPQARGTQSATSHRDL
jgi:bifunctional DNase/RNase